jgi:hypothetical protein
MIRTIVLSGALVFSLTGAAFAQTDTMTAAPIDAATGTAGSGTAAWTARRAVMALRGAYRAIGEAQVLGASPYLDAAKAHYRGALARYAKNDPGAAAEAQAAASLARAAAAEHPAPAPRDLPAPPVAGAAMGRSGFGAMSPGGFGRPGMAMRGGPWMHGRRGGANRFDPTRVAADAKLAGTAEAKDLAQKALDADLARSKAAFAGNADEAQRDGRLAGALASAVRSLAYAEHPPTHQRREHTPGSGWSHQTPGGGIVGGAGNT